MLAALIMGAALAVGAGTAQADLPCGGDGPDRAVLVELESRDLVAPDAAVRNALAVKLTACLGHPDPLIRDGVAFAALARFMRENQLEKATLLRVQNRLLAAIEPTPADPEGFRRPFAALTLAEIARADRLQPFLTNADRKRILDAGVRYMAAINDYRGFVPGEGWRHGVAHASDLLMQLTLNPETTPEDLARIRDAVGKQIAPPGEHFYVYGESERLARPILFVGRRGVFSEADWTAWFAKVTAPAPLASWDLAYASRMGLAKRHNTRAFLLALYAYCRSSGDANLERLLPGLEKALSAMP